jgi:hypothetical protein
VKRAALVLALLACVPPPEPVANPRWGAAARFHCSYDARCPELAIEGAPHAQAWFRGVGDPSLERDPETGALWLAYSWLDVAGPDFAIRTQLARSDDRGRSFSVTSSANEVERRPDARGRAGLWVHEVPTLARAPGPLGLWRLVWLSYFDPLGAGPREYAEPSLVAVRAETPAAFGVARGAPLSLPPEGTRDCVAFTEPALFAEDGQVSLAANCIVFWLGTRRAERERLLLWRDTGEGWTRAGALLDAADARALGGDRVEQADLARGRDGSLLLFVTPIREGEDPAHQGCVVLDVEDLAGARIRRNADGSPRVRAVLSADGNGLGPGMCTYDAASETGVLLVITRFDLASDPPDLLFSLRRTGFHP